MASESEVIASERMMGAGQARREVVEDGAWSAKSECASAVTRRREEAVRVRTK